MSSKPEIRRFAVKGGVRQAPQQLRSVAPPVCRSTVDGKDDPLVGVPVSELGELSEHATPKAATARPFEVRGPPAATLELSTDAVIGKTLDGAVTTWDAGAAHMYGYRAEEIVGHSVSTLVPADRPIELLAILERLRRGDRVDHFETKRVRKDGAVLDVSLTISPIRDKAGKIVGASTIAHDFTDRTRPDAEFHGLRDGLEQSVTILRTLDGVIPGPGRSLPVFSRQEDTDGGEEPVVAIHFAHEGEGPRPITNLSGIVPLRPAGRVLGSDLGSRELEVLQLMATGLANKALARELHLSLNTVRNHVQHILYKLAAHSKLEAVATAVRAGLIERALPVADG